MQAETHNPGRASVLMRKCRTAVRQPVAVVALIPVAWVMIGLSSAAIALLPFRRLAPVLGKSLGATSVSTVATLSAQRRAGRIGSAIAIAAKYAPFRSNCLPQAFVAACFCRLARVPYAAHLGASLTNDEGREGLVAHAWVNCGRVAVTGGSGNFHRYGVVACFVRARAVG